MKRRLLVLTALACAATPSWAIDCATVPGNLVANCGFETGVPPWTMIVGGGFGGAGAGQNNLGARLNGDQAGNGTIRSNCVVSQPGLRYTVGIAADLDGPNSAATCTVGVQEFSDNACATPTAYTAATAAQALIQTYTDFQGQHQVSAGTGSIALQLVCSQGVAGFEVNVDNGILALLPDVIAVPLSPAALALLAAGLGLAALQVLRRSH
jgi:hypothetical protein